MIHAVILTKLMEAVMYYTGKIMTIDTFTSLGNVPSNVIKIVMKIGNYEEPSCNIFETTKLEIFTSTLLSLLMMPLYIIYSLLFSSSAKKAA